jgi:hypothetical protein
MPIFCFMGDLDLVLLEEFLDTGFGLDQKEFCEKECSLLDLRRSKNPIKSPSAHKMRRNMVQRDICSQSG